MVTEATCPLHVGDFLEEVLDDHFRIAFIRQSSHDGGKWGV